MSFHRQTGIVTVLGMMVMVCQMAVAAPFSDIPWEAMSSDPERMADGDAWVGSINACHQGLKVESGEPKMTN